MSRRWWGGEDLALKELEEFGVDRERIAVIVWREICAAPA
jgi:hypothetical protein